VIAEIARAKIVGGSRRVPAGGNLESIIHLQVSPLAFARQLSMRGVGVVPP